MTQTQIPQRPNTPATPSDHASGHGGGHHWMMIACCIPMLVIAAVLVATGVAGAGFILVALMCTAMIAMMMGCMSHDSDDRQRHH